LVKDQGLDSETLCLHTDQTILLQHWMAKGLINVLQILFATYSIPDELSFQAAISEFTALETDKFLSGGASTIYSIPIFPGRYKPHPT